MNSKIFGLFVVLMLLFGSGNLFAQNAQELRFGASISGNLNGGAEIWYNIRVTENCFLTVETTGNTDTYLEIYDSRRNLIMENDDGGNDNNAKVEIIAASGSNYLVKLSGYGGYSSGPFSILATYTSLPASVELRLGNALQGNISPGQRIIYVVRTTQEGFYIVETSGNTDTYLDVYDSSYVHLGYDDDGGSDNNARIEIIAEANKTYYFILRGYSSGTSGPYRILASFESADSRRANIPDRSTAAVLRLGESTPVSIAQSYQSRWFVYEVTATVTFVVQTRGGMDTRLYLYDRLGNLLQEDDDSGDNYNALISRRLNAGTYFIEVKGYGSETGSCTLHAETR